MTRHLWWIAALTLAVCPTTVQPQTLPGFQKTVPFDEQVKWSRLDSGVRVLVNHPLKVSDVLKDPRLNPRLSTEGPMDVAELRQAAGWGR